ncbi:MAG TPA: peptide-methionine (S)-S-oxide reductase MsrA [Bryobacteraceae bacterium]|nr:peptide-methionine (S)-S-oxide reductase MsrA [Bryobacteraceae bacterium]
MRSLFVRLLVAAGGFATLAAGASLPDPKIDVERAAAKAKQVAVFAGGCFWCTEAVFEEIAGVEKVISGYAGGDKKSAHYEMVSSGRTDHAESIQITFDPAKVSFGTLLKVFFSVAHDPTQLNMQGPDHGRQYRSAIFYVNAEQKRVAEAYIKQLDEAKVFSRPIVTQVAELKAFYPAEEYHQDYVKRNPDNPYVVINAIPKVKKTRAQFEGMIKK